MKTFSFSTAFFGVFAAVFAAMPASGVTAQSATTITCVDASNRSNQLRLIVADGTLAQVAFDNIDEGQFGDLRALVYLGRPGSRLPTWAIVDQPATHIMVNRIPSRMSTSLTVYLTSTNNLNTVETYVCALN